MIFFGVLPKVRPLLVALALPLFLGGCSASPPGREIRPASPVETPVAAPPAAASVLPPPGEEPGMAPPSAAAPVPSVSEAAPPAAVPEPLPEAAAATARAEGMTGVATYYARRFNGRPTTSGVPYDPAKLTAAHQSIPFGTKVMVVNLANGREVTVTVNDRCRKRTFPFIDLSRAAAERLGFLGKGTAKVRIIPMNSEER